LRDFSSKILGFGKLTSSTHIDPARRHEVDGARMVVAYVAHLETTPARLQGG
jgi:hypothetical protein